MTISELLQYCMAKPGAEQSVHNDWKATQIKVEDVLFAMVKEVENRPAVSLKTSPELAELLRQQHSDVRPSRHLNKAHWSTVYLDGSLPDSQIYYLVDASYQQAVKMLPERIVDDVNPLFGRDASEKTHRDVLKGIGHRHVHLVVHRRRSENGIDRGHQRDGRKVEVELREKQPFVDPLLQGSFQSLLPALANLGIDPLEDGGIEPFQIAHEIDVGHHHVFPIFQQQDKLLDDVAGRCDAPVVFFVLRRIKMPHAFDDQRLPVAEQFVNRPLRDAQAGRDIVHPDRLHAVTDKQIRRLRYDSIF